MADNNKVTIDAAWFSELYAKANGGKSGERPCDGCPIVGDLDEMRTECALLRKDRDERQAERDKEREKVKELKAQLEQERMNKCDEVTAKRLAAAERCIEDISKRTMFKTTKENIVIGIIDIILAYSEQKEAAR